MLRQHMDGCIPLPKEPQCTTGLRKGTRSLWPVPCWTRLKLSSTASSLESEKHTGLVGNFCSDKAEHPMWVLARAAHPARWPRGVLLSLELPPFTSDTSRKGKETELQDRWSFIYKQNYWCSLFINLMQVWAYNASGDKLNTTDSAPDCN